MSARVGVFLCQGGRSQADSLEFKKLRWTAEAFDQGRVFTVAHTCQTQGAAAVARLIKEHELTSAVVGACPLLHNPGGLSRALAAEGLDPQMATVLDLCAKPEGEASGVCAVAPGAQAALSQALCGEQFKQELPLEELAVATSVLVVGEGLPALWSARGLLKAGYHPVLLTPSQRLAPPAPLLGKEAVDEAAALAKELEEADGVTLIRQGRLMGLGGGAGNFTATIADRAGEIKSLMVGGVIVAQAPPKALNLPPQGLTAGERVVSLEDLATLLQAPEHLKKRLGQGPYTVALGVGLGRQAAPLDLIGAMNCARKLAAGPENRVVLFTNNAKVAGDDLEALTQQVRGEGVVFVKFTTGGLRGGQTPEGVELQWDEEILGATMGDRFDLLALNQTPAPNPAYHELAHRLGLSVGRDGYLQPEAVNALPAQSRRAGVWLVGPARGQGDLERWADEVQEALYGVRRLLAQGTVRVESSRVMVDRKRCTICLTCVRVCPEGAMDRLFRRPMSNPLACTGCGTCAAECPMEAIQIVGQEDTRYSGEIAAAAGKVGDLGQAVERRLLVLACANSATPALHAARLQGAALPSGLRLVQVPCAGKVDADMVLEGLQRGFDGVLILSCHPDACYSLTGSTWAGMRAGHLGNLLAETGLEPERLMLSGVAPSQSQEVLAVIKKALATLDQLGPSPLKVGAQVREVLTRYTLDMDDTFSIVG